MSLRNEIETVLRHVNYASSTPAYGLYVEDILAAIEAEANKHLFEMSRHMWVGALGQRSRGVKDFVKQLVAED